MLKIVADSAIVWLDKLFAVHGEIIRYSGREIDRKILINADLLLTRSTVKVNKALLQNTSIKLVASATVGCDHVNQKDLDELGIEFIHAPGCNANAVAEYVVAALAWHEKQNLIRLDQNLTAAVIGCGQIGSKVKQKLEILGFNVIVNDPPLEQSIKSLAHNSNSISTNIGVRNIQGNYRFVDLYEALQADVISMHTPLTKSGDHPSYHLLDEQKISQINPKAVLINAGRGEVINNKALLQALNKKLDLNVVLDVWENEPIINWQLFEKVNIGTPHIAGHSWRGKVMGTVMIYQQACKFFGWSPKSIDENDLKIQLPIFELTEGISLYDVVAQCYDIEADYKNLRSKNCENAGQQAAIQFDHFRKRYYQRPEFQDLKCYGNVSLDMEIIQTLGFNLQ